MDDLVQPELDRIRRLAQLMAATDPGPAGELAGEIAAAVAGLSVKVEGLSARVDALWQLISSVVESAGLGDPADSAGPGGDARNPRSAPPPEFVQALASARRTGRRGVRLSIDGKDWVAALSQQPPEPDPASWSAIERIARRAGDQDER
jgi:hypothetical protein